MVLQQTWGSQNKGELIKLIFQSLHISGVGPTGFSQQFKTRHDIPSKVISVQGGWLSSFVFEVTSTRFALKDDFFSLDIRICPESLVQHVRTTMLPLTIQQFYIGGYTEQVDHLLAPLRDLAADPHQCSNGWLGHFFFEQVYLLEHIFKVKCHGMTKSTPC